MWLMLRKLNSILHFLYISEISCISNQQTLPLPSLHTMTMSGSKERIIETRFSLPSNVFLQPNLTMSSGTSYSSGHSGQAAGNMGQNKYATLGRVRKNSGYNKGKIIGMGDSSITQACCAFVL